MFLLFLLFSGLEVYLFFHFVGVFGFIDTLITYLSPSFLGYLILQMQGRKGWSQWQNMAQSKTPPGGKILHQGIIALSGILLMIPTVVSRIVGILFLLPGTRHFFAWRLKKYFFEKMSQFQQKGFGPQGQGGFKFYSFSSGPQGTHWQSSEENFQSDVDPNERDVTIIDVEPKRVEKKLKLVSSQDHDSEQAPEKKEDKK